MNSKSLIENIEITSNTYCNFSENTFENANMLKSYFNNQDKNKRERLIVPTPKVQIPLRAKNMVDLN